MSNTEYLMATGETSPNCVEILSKKEMLTKNIICENIPNSFLSHHMEGDSALLFSVIDGPDSWEMVFTIFVYGLDDLGTRLLKICRGRVVNVWRFPKKKEITHRIEEIGHFMYPDDEVYWDWSVVGQLAPI